MNWDEPYNLTAYNRTFVFQRPSIAVPIVSWILVALQLLLVGITFVLVVLRKEYQPLKARNPYFVLISQFGLSFVLLNMEVSQGMPNLQFFIHLGVGQWRYPCLITSLNNSFALAFVAFPVIMRTWKLLYIYKLNKLKTRVAGFTESDKKMLYQPLDEHSASFKDAQQRKIFRRWAFWISTPFILIVVCLLFLYSLVFWLIGYVAVNVDYPRFFSFGSCYEVNVDYMIPLVRSGLVLVQAVLYMIVELLLLGMLLINRVRDRYGITIETIYSVIFWSIAIVIFFASSLGFFVAFEGTFNMNRFWPLTTRSVAIACLIDSFITGFLPAAATFLPTFNKRAVEKKDEMKQNFLDNPSDTILGDILRDSMTREQFKQFSMESFCTENVLFWEDIQHYKQATSASKLVLYADQIVNKYLVENCPLELNIMNRDKTCRHIQLCIERVRAQENLGEKQTPREKENIFNSSSNSIMDASDFRHDSTDQLDAMNVMLPLFDDVMAAVEINMLDTIGRFLQTVAYHRIRTQSNYANEMMNQAGIVQRQ